jgi:HK97 family phage major capsid protein
MNAEIKAALAELAKAVEDQREVLEARIKALEAGTGVADLTERLAKAEAAVEKAQDDVVAATEKFEAAGRIRMLTPTGAEAQEREVLHAREFARASQEYLKKAPVALADVEPDLDLYRAYCKDIRNYMLTGAITNAMRAAGDDTGGYLVDPAIDAAVTTIMRDRSAVRQVCRVDTIGTDRLRGRLQFGHVGVRWVGETTTPVSAATPTFGEWEIPVMTMECMPELTQELIDDASMDMEGFLSADISDSFSEAEEDCFINGTGGGGVTRRPRGMLTYTYSDGEVARDGSDWGEKVRSVLSGAEDTISNPDVFIALTTETLRMRYQANARFAMNRHVLSLVRQIKDGDGRYFWVPNISQGPYGEILGRPVSIFDHMSNPSATGRATTPRILFGDFRAFYRIVDRRGMYMLRDPYTNTPWVRLKTYKRVGGDVVDFDAVAGVIFND